MRRTTNIHVLAGALAALSIGLASSATAGITAWACKGQQGGQQFVFNRYSLIVAPESPSIGTLDDFYFVNDALKKPDGAAELFEAKNIGVGIEEVLTFTTGSEPRRTITFAETSSRKTSVREGRAGPRDEFTTLYKKVYRLTGDGEAPRVVAMACKEYILSSRSRR